MVVVMTAEAGDTEVDGVVDKVRAAGGDAFVSRGMSRTIVGLVGNVDHLETLNLRGMPGVSDVMRISAPYKLVSREHHRERSVIRVGGVPIGPDTLTVIAGPCAVETAEQTLAAAVMARAAGASLLRGGAYKPRTSPYSFQGMGEDGLRIMAEVRDKFGMRIVTEAVDNESLDLVEQYADQEPMFGIEQEYTFIKDGRPLGWPLSGYPAPQGPYYCGVGGDKMPGREIVEQHTVACMKAGLGIEGTNAEVMMGQWEFQIGVLSPLDVSDHLWVARWLLFRIAEDFGVFATLEPKPIMGDWNGAGAHTNFSTKAMREDGGWDAIIAGCEAIGKRIDEHIAVYGVGIETRLTGAHETAHYTKFSYGTSDRGASIRIPWAVAKAKKGWLEDRRPNANMDPYKVTGVLVETVCGDAASD